MPKTEIDYSSTIIYKITCKNTAITDVYVGHTTNFVQRKHAHKQNCINNKTDNYKCKLYEVIRANGGWTNWNMEIINFFNCADSYEARKKEQEYFIALNATLNSIEPLPKPKMVSIDNASENNNLMFYCDICKIKCINSKTYENHKNTTKHKNKIQNSDSSVLVKNTNFHCEKCDFTCSKRGDYNRHIITPKHINAADDNDENNLSCSICNSLFKHASSLSRHKKNCTPEGIKNTNDKDNLIEVFIKENQDFKGMMIELMKSNLDLQKQMLEFCKNKPDF
jgi:hypothetical protein